MIENIVRAYLKSTLNIPSYLEEPINPPAEYIIVEKTGSSDGEHIGRATLAVQTYSDSMLKAGQLCKRVKAQMEQIPTLENVTRCKCGGDYNFTDPETHRYRYQAVFYVTYYEE